MEINSMINIAKNIKHDSELFLHIVTIINKIELQKYLEEGHEQKNIKTNIRRCSQFYI